MDGKISAVNYLSSTSNDYCDHHSIQSLSNLPYYQSDVVDCFYHHQKSDFQTPHSFTYHSSQQQTFGYSSSVYDIQSSQPCIQEHNIRLLQNQSRLPSVYQLSSSQTRQSTSFQSNVPSLSRVIKSEIEDTTSTSEKNQVYEWMKGEKIMLTENN